MFIRREEKSKSWNDFVVQNPIINLILFLDLVLKDHTNNRDREILAIGGKFTLSTAFQNRQKYMVLYILQLELSWIKTQTYGFIGVIIHLIVMEFMVKYLENYPRILWYNLIVSK